jgi:hypothetical protein
MKVFKIVASMCIAVALVGCGATPNFYVDKSATQNISSTDVYITIAQKEINAEIDRSSVAAAGGGGLLFALIDVAVENSRATDAEKLVQPIKDGLVDVDFTELFSESLKQELSEIKWLNVKNVIINNDLTETLAKDNFDASSTDAVLFVNANYSMSSSFDMLKGNSTTSLYPKVQELKQYSEKGDSKKAFKNPLHVHNVLYRDSVSVSNSPILAGTDKEQNAQLMIENIEGVRESFRSIASKLAKAVAVSITQTRAPKA